MNTEASHDLRLWLPDQKRAVTARDEINSALRDLGSAIWPLEVSSAPEDIREFLAAPSLDEVQSQHVADHFLLPRERLIELVGAAGRTPEIAGGGFLSTTDKTHGIVYPQLYQVLEGIDYSRFDRFHMNRSRALTGVDEVMHVLCGRGIVLHQKIPGRGVLRLEIDCPPGQGWTLTYDGNLPHIGSISGATLGAKILMQVFGPAEWEMHYI